MKGATSRRWVGWYLVVVGVAVGVLWVLSLPGAFQDGLLIYAGTEAVGNIPVFHLLAELAMAAAAVAGGVLLLRRHRHGAAVALLANGMLIYSAVNSSGWLWHNQPAVVALTAATLVGSVLSTVSLVVTTD